MKRNFLNSVRCTRNNKGVEIAYCFDNEQGIETEQTYQANEADLVEVLESTGVLCEPCYASYFGTNEDVLVSSGVSFADFLADNLANGCLPTMHKFLCEYDPNY